MIVTQTKFASTSTDRMTPRSASVSNGISGSITEATISCADETVVAATVTTPLPGAPERRSAFRREAVPVPRYAIRHVRRGRRRNRRNVQGLFHFGRMEDLGNNSVELRPNSTRIHSDANFCQNEFVLGGSKEFVHEREDLEQGVGRPAL
ncbi:hypothetical protein GCM10020255_033190 [Rhodococcus baikonurensis]